jgi:CHAT domain
VPFRSVASRLVRGGAERMAGLRLEVLRPAAFPRLAKVLREAAGAGRPYHVVHFDGHGTYLDVAALQGDGERAAVSGGGGGGVGVSPLRYGMSVAGPVREGPHGYLIFEDPGSGANQQLVDGPALGRLLTGAGVPGVVAMRYIVYVVTAAQYVADLYAHLLAGESLGKAATAARRALAADPAREVGPVAVTLQDWAVPVVYEAAPLTLLRPEEREAPLIRLAPADSPGAAGVPRPPDAGFFGRDETLLAMDRAFDTGQVVLLHAFAGAGKTTTAAEFARWYAGTGGLYHSELGMGPVLWSSFEHHLPLDRLLDAAGDAFGPALEASGIHWQAITDLDQRRGLVLAVLREVPVLWVWDNTEPVTGFPPGTSSAWTSEEQDQIAGFLADLAQQTRCKVLLASRRDEQRWAGPGRWPPPCPTGSPTPSPAPSGPSSPSCTCSATPSTPTPSATWATQAPPGRTRSPSWPG